MTRLFRALSDETRLRILNLLLERECCVCEVMQALGISQTRASRNLGILENAGLVHSRRDGLWVTHYLDEEGMSEYAADAVGLVEKALKGSELAAQDRERLRKATRMGPQVAWRLERRAKSQQLYGGEKMRIAIASEDERGLDAPVSQHFGRCPYYTLVEVEAGEIKEVKVVNNPFYGSHGQPGEVPGFIHSQGAQVIIAGGMGPRAIGFFNQFGIETITGAFGRVREALSTYLGGQLSGSQPCWEGEEESEGGELLELRERMAALQDQLAKLQRRINQLSSPQGD